MAVEDDHTILHLLMEVLKSEGFQAVGVATPDEALEVAIRHRPAVILIDIMLPERSGVQVAEELRAHGFGRTPMIALSASTIMRELAAHTGLFEAIMAKPFDIDRLCDRIHALIDVPGRSGTDPVSAYGEG